MADAPPATPQYPALGGLVNPVPGGSYARVDQGTDYVATQPVLAIGSGTIERVAPPGSWVGGTGEAVYEKLDNPVTVGGRTYTGVYYAEQHPLVSKGDRVTAGYPVMAAGGNELGFESGGHAVAPLVGGLGAGTQLTQAGADFAALVGALGGPSAGSAATLYPFGGSTPSSGPITTPVPVPSAPATSGPITSPVGLPSLPSFQQTGFLGVDTSGFFHTVGAGILKVTDPANVPGFKQAGQVADVATSVPDFLGKLSKASTWVRVLEIGGGGLLMLLGLVIVGRSLTTAKTVVTVAEGARTLREATPGRRRESRVRASAPGTRRSTVRDYGSTRAPSRSHLREAEQERRLREEESADIPF